MNYDALIMARQHHEETINKLSRSYADAQADSKSLQALLSSGLGWISATVKGIGSQNQHSIPNSYERRPSFAPVILDDRQGDSW